MTPAKTAIFICFFIYCQTLVAAGPARVERVVYLMGTRVTLTVEADQRALAVRQLERMVQSLETTEAALSTWRAESALSVVNRHPIGQPVGLPSAVCSLWSGLTTWHRVTAGAFDPTVGALSEVWGLRSGGRRPTTDELESALMLTGLKHFEFDPPTCRLTRLADATLDAGAFGKGEALRRLQSEFREHAPWRVDIGGQIAVSDESPKRRWRVPVAHPSRRAESVVELWLDTGSLATSSVSERSFEVEGERIGHIVNPRTGQVVFRTGSVTVWHDDPFAADILSTALFVMGIGEGFRYAETHGLAVLFLSPAPAGEHLPPVARSSPAFVEKFWPSGDGVARSATALSDIPQVVP